MEIFAQNLRFLRENRGLKLQQVKTSIGFNRTTWNGYETGYSTPNFKDLIKIAEFFGISETELIHSDLQKGNLMPNNQDSNNNIKGNLNSNLNSNLISKKQAKTPYPQSGLSPIKHHLNEPQTPYFTAQMPKVITIDHTGNENILYVPVKAQAGYLNGYEDPTYLEHLPAFSMPGLRNGTYRMFEVQGQSMYPTLSSTDKVIAQFIPDIKEIIENHIHIIIHQNGVAIKRVLNRIVERGKICLISDGHTRHKEYPAIELNADEIKEIWYVRMRITSQLHEPVELYTRMAEAELNISQILKKIGTI